ncbi:AraC family transcriptional regulator [Jeongeupia naejangsanensis]|uniref:AraC family transcriptional regulator n=1 Tax=Jeongeupia naejangsanensis TaxID=613195 RepID=A0ABS2BM21_9NEIS|nr:AraC family transcriptional regulator [Jeongeupia naejangsanensis]MBM3116623.1 AraC family transcriptional regulator [Jeongeupia naejangsanensis]
MANAHLVEYSCRMNRVLDHIDRHLDAPLDLATLADVAHFSPFHFHRIFQAWLGETLGDYLRRRRLEVAAATLAIHPDEPVLNIALAVGFGSGEAFARAFKTRFGVTPSEWRRQTPARWQSQLDAIRERQAQNRNPDQAQRNVDQAGAGMAGHDEGSLPDTEITMNVTIQTLPPARIAYLRHIGPYGPALGQFWRGHFAPWARTHGLSGQTSYGIAYDDPSVTPADKCRYDAAVEVPADFVATGEAGIAELPGGRYAVARFKGDVRTIGDAWMTLTRDWLPSSGYQFDNKPCFERYDSAPDEDTSREDFSCDRCIPVRPL